MKETAQQALRAGEIVRRMRDFLSHGETEHRVESLPKLITEANALALVGSREHGIDVQGRGGVPGRGERADPAPGARHAGSPRKRERSERFRGVAFMT